jgi:hypothetical protein
MPWQLAAWTDYVAAQLAPYREPIEALERVAVERARASSQTVDGPDAETTETWLTDTELQEFCELTRAVIEIYRDHGEDALAVLREWEVDDA